MLLLFTITTVGTRGFVELFPGFADSVFGRGPEGLATLTSTVGLGAIFGAGWMLLRPAITGLTRLVLGNTLIISLAILAFTLTNQFYVALPCVFVAGAAMTITGVGAQTLIQAAVDIRMRGRIMALYGMIFRAGPAVGAVLMGSLSGRFGLRLPLAVGALVSCGFWAPARLKQRHIAETLEADPVALSAGTVPAAAGDFVVKFPHLFCFGFGYTARVLARLLAAEGWIVDGTCRTEDKAAALRAAGFRVQVSSTATIRFRGKRWTGSRISWCRFLPMPRVTSCSRCIVRTSPVSKVYVGWAIFRRLVCTATAAAAGSTRLPSCRRAANAAAGGSLPKRAGSISGATAACRCTSSVSPAYTALAAAPSKHSAPVRRNASTSRTRYSRVFMSRIWHVCSPPRSAGRGQEPSTMSATTTPPHPRPSSRMPRCCSACRRRRSCRSKPPGSRRWRAASTTTTNGCRTG